MESWNGGDIDTMRPYTTSVGQHVIPQQWKGSEQWREGVGAFFGGWVLIYEEKMKKR